MMEESHAVKKATQKLISRMHVATKELRKEVVPMVFSGYSEKGSEPLRFVSPVTGTLRQVSFHIGSCQSKTVLAAIKIRHISFGVSSMEADVRGGYSAWELDMKVPEGGLVHVILPPDALDVFTTCLLFPTRPIVRSLEEV